MDIIHDKVVELSRPLLSNYSVYVNAVIGFYSIYLKENCLGPSVYTQYVEETKAPIVRTGPLPDNELDPLSYKNQEL